MDITRVLTGITTTGIPHLGNYTGAIRPAIAESMLPGVSSFFFLADYHALVKCADPGRLAQSRIQVAATWLASGLDPERVIFYRQSDIKEIPELCWILTCIVPKGLMNRAHAYKARVNQNTSKTINSDDKITMGLFSYPILMTADILLFNAHRVPVGQDQIQHVEIACDIAQRFNHVYKKNIFTLPKIVLGDNRSILPGLDGKKMSKTYNNTIPLFDGCNKSLWTAIKHITTDSHKLTTQRNIEKSSIYKIYREFSSSDETEAFKAQLEQGMCWSDAKKTLYDLLRHTLLPMKERYIKLMSRPKEVEEILQFGAEKARSVAKPFMESLREEVGFRSFTGVCFNVNQRATEIIKRKQQPRFVSFRDRDKKYYFRLLSSSNEELLHSLAYTDTSELGAVVDYLQTVLPEKVIVENNTGYSALVRGAVVAHSPKLLRPDDRDKKLFETHIALASLFERKKVISSKT